MKQIVFEKEHKSFWASFEQSLAKIARKGRVPVDFPEHYRKICYHLALSKSRLYSDSTIRRLEDMAFQGHHVLYSKQKSNRQNLFTFLAFDFPIALRYHWRYFLLSACLFVFPFFAAMLVVLQDTNLAYVMVPEASLQQAASSFGENWNDYKSMRKADSDVLMWGFYIWNNVGIDLKIFAGGFLLGLGAVFFIVYNGVVLGAVTGYMIAIGNTENFFSFTSGHGPFELTAAVIAGAAGLRLGHGILRPGRQKVSESVLLAAKEGMTLLYGAAFLTFSAAFIEAFWSPNTLFEPQVKYNVGYALWVLTFMYLFLVGRGREYRRP